MRFPGKGRALVPAWIAVGSACALFGRGGFEEPEVQVSQVAVRGVGLSGGELAAVLNVTNPNDFDINGKRLDMALEVEGEHVADIVLDEPFTVPRNQCIALTVPVQFGWKGAASAAKSALAYGKLDYTLKGDVTVGSPLGEMDVPFNREGSATVSELADSRVAVPNPTGRTPPTVPSDTSSDPSGPAVTSACASGSRR